MEVTCFVVGAFEENCYIVAEGHDAIIIDPGEDPQRLLSEIQARNLKVGAIVCTHAHLDHVGAVESLMEATKAPFCIHKADVPLLDMVPGQALMFGFAQDIPPKPTRILNDGDTISAGALTLKVIHTPGHTPGGICLLGDGVLFAGDTLFAGSVGRTDLAGGSHAQLIRSIQEKILPLDDSITVYPGHGSQTTIRAERRNNPFL
jgi:glyoxylase-like metal-dependent hydrolase (beta-lactamase superfamily II)